MSFGHDRWGRDPFGEAAWSRRTLWLLIPELQRDADTTGLLQAFIEGLFPSFDHLRRSVRNFTDLRDPLKVRTQYDWVARLKLGRHIVVQGEIEQSGLDGYVDALGRFVSPTGRFRETAVGKELVVRGSSNPANNRSVVVTVDVDLHTIATDPALAPDAGFLRWELREMVSAPSDYVTVEVRGGSVSDITPGWLINDGYADFTVVARRQFAAVGGLAFQTDKEGSDGAISGGYFTAASGEFTPKDVGRFITISGSSTDENNGRFEIVSVDMSVAPPRLLLKGFLTTDAGPLTWALLPHPQLDLSGRAVPVGVVEQEGTSMVITGGGAATVSDTNASFDSTEDVGKYVDLRGSSAGQDGHYRIVSVMGVSTVELDTTFATGETGIYWELRAATGAGIIERGGRDLEITRIDYPVAGQSEVIAPTGGWDPSEVGMSLVLAGSITSNNTTVSIVDVTDEETAIVGTALTLDEGPLTWNLVSGDFTKQNARAESIIKFMAPDFGLAIDTQESEDRQRSFVDHVNAWLDLKGNEHGYEVLGAISGFEVEVFNVYRVTFAIAEELRGTAEIYGVAEEGAGRSGTGGSLTLSGTAGQLYDPAAAFRASDEALSVQLYNCADSDNNGLYDIATVEDSNTLVFELPTPAGSLPDYGSGGTIGIPTIRWSLVRFYSDQPPTQPNFDEVVADQLTDWVDANLPGKVFGIDRYCWEEDFAAYVTVEILSVTNLSGLTYEVKVNGEADVIPRNPAGPTRQVLDGPFWKLIDSDGKEFVVETAPEADGADWTFEIVADPAALPTASPPATQDARLEYQCSIQSTCDYCAASVVVAIISAGDVINETGVAVERVLERVIERLQTLAKPKHVRLVPILKQTLEASLNIRAEVNADALQNLLLAPLTAYFDDIALDDIALDTAIVVEVDATDTVWVGGGW